MIAKRRADISFQFINHYDLISFASLFGTEKTKHSCQGHFPASAMSKNTVENVKLHEVLANSSRVEIYEHILMFALIITPRLHLREHSAAELPLPINQLDFNSKIHG